MDKLFASVIIPTFNRSKSLCDTLKGVFDQSYEDYEIIVVDQSNKTFAEKKAFFEKYKKKFKLVRLSFPSLPGARNRGVEAAKGDVIIFCDDDVLVGKNFVVSHLANYQDKSIDVVAGRVVEKGKGKIEKRIQKVGKVTFWGSVRGGFSSASRQEVGNLFGCNFSIRKKIFLQMGGFDENFIGNALREETDFALCLKKQGRKIIFDPKTKLIHLHILVKSGGCRKDNDRLGWYRDFFHNETYFFLKHFSFLFLPVFFLVRWQYFFRSMFGFGREVSWRSLAVPWQGIYSGFKTIRSKNENRN